MNLRFPNPRVRLPQWGWLDRFDRWRAEHGILTGRWTQSEIDENRRRAHEDYLALKERFGE